MALHLLQSSARMLCKDAILLWIRFLEGDKSPRTVALYKMVIWRFEDDLPQKIKLHHITREHIERHLDRLPTTCNKSINCYLMAIKSFFTYCEEAFGIPSPAAKIKKRRESAPHQRVLTEDEFQHILEVCDEQEKAVVQLLAHTGLRANLEFPQALNPANVSNSMLHCVCKGGRLEATPLNHTAKNAIAILLSHIDFSKNISRRNHLYYLCCRLAKRAQIPKFTPHSLRYYFGDSLRRCGVSIFEISKLYHHSSVKQTMAYLHLPEEELRGLTDVLDTSPPKQANE